MFCIQFCFSSNSESLRNIFALHGVHIAHRYVESFRKTRPFCWLCKYFAFRKVLKYLIKRHPFDNIGNFFTPNIFLLKLKIKILLR